MDDCLFCRIVSKEIPALTVYEDNDVMAFLDIKPVNPGHTLVVPKVHSSGFHDATPEALHKLILATQRVANAVMLAMGVEGFNLEQNNGEIAGQVIKHLHLHVVPRHPLDGLKHWPGKEYGDGEAGAVAEQIKKAFEI